jgi:hypothetical protein
MSLFLNTFHFCYYLISIDGSFSLTQVATIRVQRQSAVLNVSLFRYPSAKMDIDYLGFHESLLVHLVPSPRVPGVII